eukprot:6362470-Amphidinium_carterae.1
MPTIWSIYSLRLLPSVGFVPLLPRDTSLKANNVPSRYSAPVVSNMIQVSCASSQDGYGMEC